MASLWLEFVKVGRMLINQRVLIKPVAFMPLEKKNKKLTFEKNKLQQSLLKLLEEAGGCNWILNSGSSQSSWGLRQRGQTQLLRGIGRNRGSLSHAVWVLLRMCVKQNALHDPTFSAF